jgi:hypothetical protein
LQICTIDGAIVPLKTTLHLFERGTHVKFSRVRGVTIGSLGATILVLAACSSGPKSPPNAGQIIIQSAAANDGTLVQLLTPSVTGPSYNLDRSFGVFAISPAGTPVPGAIYVSGKDSNIYRINPGSSPVSISIGGTATSHIEIAPHGAKNAGAAMVLTDQGLATLQPGGGVTNIPIPDAADLAVAPKGAHNAGTAYITSKSTSSLYIVDPLATSARTMDLGFKGGKPLVAPTGTPDAGMAFIYPDRANLDGGDDQLPAQVTEFIPPDIAKTTSLPNGVTINNGLSTAIAPSKTKHAGDLFFTGTSDGHLYELTASGTLSSVDLGLDSTNSETASGLLVADAGVENAGDIYVNTSLRILKVDPSGQVTTILTGGSTNALELLAIAPAKAPNAGALYVATSAGHGGELTEIHPDDSQTNFSLSDDNINEAVVAPAGTQLAGTLLTWSMDGHGVNSLSPNGQTGVIGSQAGILDVKVVPK